MKRLFHQESLLVKSRFIWASLIVFIVTGMIILRLWYIQVYRGQYYVEISERNRVRRIEIPVPRGVIYDRHGDVVIGNRPYFDLVYIPQYVNDKSATFKILSRLLHIPVSIFRKRIDLARGRPKFLPITLKKNLSLHEVSIIESNKIFLPGIEIRVAPRRHYQSTTPPHMVGYLREIDSKTMKRFNEKNVENPYLPGDLVGKQGLEAKWESYLRGKRGFRLIQVDAFGRQSQMADFEFPERPAVPGSDLELTIDLKLQEAVKNAFKGKNGAVVVLNPTNGQILAEVSEPGFDPAILQTGLSNEEWRRLTSNPFKPFLDKTTGGEFPPGSVFKPVVALAALQENIITPQTTYRCPGSFTLGDQTFACHDRSGHGIVNLRRAMMKSCDVYFYQIGVELGVDRLSQYARAFGLGKRLGVQLNMERPGLVPSSAWKQLVHRFPWTAGDTPSVSIGQGYMLMTPMQMVNLYAAIGNGGTVWRPYLVQRITNHFGEVVFHQRPQMLKRVAKVSQENLALMASYLQDVVMNREGTGKRAAVEGVTVAGKTGSVQVVSLKKNRNQVDVSMKWKEHAMFAAFSPVIDPEIAVAVVSQNDKVGGGGKSAAPVAGKIIATYWQLKKQRQVLKKRVSVKDIPSHGHPKKL